MCFKKGALQPQVGTWRDFVQKKGKSKKVSLCECQIGEERISKKEFLLHYSYADACKPVMPLLVVRQGTNMLGGIKPPKLKVEDEEHTYIQRPVQEQWRPAQPKPAGPQGKPPNKPPTKRQ